MDVTDVARSKTGIFLSIGRSKIFEQFDFVTAGRFYDREFELGAFDAGDLFRDLTFLMRSVRKFKTEHIAPKRERPFEIRDRDPGVIRRNNPARAHARNRRKRPTRLR